MAAFSAVDIALFLLATAAAFVLVALWIIKSDQGKDVYRAEIKNLKSKIEESRREKYLLAEEIDSMKQGVPLPQDDASQAAPAERSEASEKLVKTIVAKNENLESENSKLKDELTRLNGELSDAKSSLEEVYKALCEE